MTESEKQLRKILAERVAILDGAMGTMIQSYKLDEQAFRGGQFAHHGQRSEGLQRRACVLRSPIWSLIFTFNISKPARILSKRTLSIRLRSRWLTTT